MEQARTLCPLPQRPHPLHGAAPKAASSCYPLPLSSNMSVYPTQGSDSRIVPRRPLGPTCNRHAHCKGACADEDAAFVFGPPYRREWCVPWRGCDHPGGGARLQRQLRDWRPGEPAAGGLYSPDGRNAVRATAPPAPGQHGLLLCRVRLWLGGRACECLFGQLVHHLGAAGGAPRRRPGHVHKPERQLRLGVDGDDCFGHP